MKEIDNITVKVTYVVRLDNLQIPDEVYEQLSNNQVFDMHDDENDEAFDWLLSNIHEDDAYDWEAEIIDIKGNKYENL